MDWFDIVTATVLVGIGVGGIAFYSWRSWRERSFNQYYAGQITMLTGFLTVFLPHRVYGFEDDFTLGIGAALIFIGLAQGAWFKRKKDARKSGVEPIARGG